MLAKYILEYMIQMTYVAIRSCYDATANLNHYK